MPDTRLLEKLFLSEVVEGRQAQVRWTEKKTFNDTLKTSLRVFALLRDTWETQAQSRPVQRSCIYRHFFILRTKQFQKQGNAPTTPIQSRFLAFCSNILIVPNRGQRLQSMCWTNWSSQSETTSTLCPSLPSTTDQQISLLKKSA